MISAFFQELSASSVKSVSVASASEKVTEMVGSGVGSIALVVAQLFIS